MLSVAIIAKNEEPFIKEAVLSAKDVSEDVVVVIDADSSDQTEKIARESGARTFIRRFDNFASQKNFAADKTSGDWVLSLDADETISNELAGQLRNFSESQFNGYKVPRLNYIFGKAIKHSNWGPSDDTHIWLYRKTQGGWQGMVHEEVVVNGPVGHLSGMKIHQNYSTVEEFLDKMNTYTSLEKSITHPLYDFARRYIWHFGFLDGWHGLFLAYLMFIYHTEVRVKQWIKK